MKRDRRHGRVRHAAHLARESFDSVAANLGEDPMSGVSYTYVSGCIPPGPAGPLAFPNKAGLARTLNSTKAGDVVFAVVSRQATDDEPIGCVASAYQISDIGIDVEESRLGFEPRPEYRREDGSYRWLFAVQPIRVWRLRDQPEFRGLKGYTKRTHNVAAISSVREVGEELANSLLRLLSTEGEKTGVIPQDPSASIEDLRRRHPWPPE